MGNAFQHPASIRPRFSLGTIQSGGAVACLCLWAAASLPAAPDASPLPAGIYWQAMDRFNHEEYVGALELLDHTPDAGKPGEQADVWNLRGAIYLHLHKYDKARTAFSKAVEKDPGLWAAHFNLAEVSFRQGKYAESRRQFEELLGRTNRFTRSDERGFLQYKLMLTQALAGDEKPAQAYLDEHRGDRSPPLMYFYLHATLEHRHGRDKQAEQWLAQADAHYPPASAQVFAESFRSLGWYTQRSEKLIAAARRRDPASSTTPAALAVVELFPGQASVSKNVPAATSTASMSVAASPAPAPRPESHTSAPPTPSFSADNVEGAQMPPAENAAADLPDNAPVANNTVAAANDPAPEDPRAVYSRPVVLGRPASSPAGKPKGTPGASPSAASTPDAGASPAARSSASPTPAASPKPGFLEKYEQAYVKFLEKSYAESRKLLDEADAIQPGQTTSVNLRGQIFKHFYETAYTAYKSRGDYTEALAQLDEADTTKPNDPDALNLRGLTCSKQKDYEHAEAAFKKAIGADPQFWAARFNYAELPFNYRNYTAARSRFEELSAQTDASKQPREAELTQFKIFLTLLLEAKVDAARSFMGHFDFTNATPARNFCQAALEFYAGNADKAQAEINTANKNFPPRLVDIFKESFYRIGWLNDPSNPNGATPPTAVAAASLTPAPTLAEAATPAPTPVLVAQATPAPTTAALPSPEAVATPVSTPPPAVAAATPALTVALAATTTPAPVATAVPTPTVARTGTPTPAEAMAKPIKRTRQDNLVRLLIFGFIFINFAWNCIRFLIALMNHKPRRAVPITRSPLYTDRPETERPDEVEVPR